MATIATAYGKEVVLKFNGTTITSQTSTDFNQSMAMRDVTTKDSINDKESRPTLKSRSFSVNGLLPQYQAAISTYQNAFTNGTIGTFAYGSGFTGEPTWSGSGYFTALNFKAPQEGNVEYSATVEVTGAVTFAAS